MLIVVSNIYALPQKTDNYKQITIQGREYKYKIKSDSSRYTISLSPINRQFGVAFRRMIDQMTFDKSKGQDFDGFNKLLNQTLASLPIAVLQNYIRNTFTEEELAKLKTGNNLYRVITFDYKIDLLDGHLYDVCIYYSARQDSYNNLVSIDKLHKLLLLTENSKYDIADGFADYLDYTYIQWFVKISLDDL